MVYTIETQKIFLFQYLRMDCLPRNVFNVINFTPLPL